MYAIISNGQITEIGDLQNLFPNEPQPTHLYAIQRGAVPVIDGVREDERFYWVTFDKYVVESDKVIRTYANTPKALEDVAEVKEDGTPLYVQVFDATVGERGAMVDTTQQLITKGLKSQYIQQFNAITNSLLTTTDWVVIRKAERNVEIPADVAAKRAAILAECDRLTQAVTAAQDMPQFVTTVMSANWSNNE
jgi:hypothetical protein